MKLPFNSLVENSAKFPKHWSCWSLLFRRLRQFRFIRLLRKFCLICSLLLGVILCLLLLKPSWLHIVRFLSPLFISTLLCMLAFLSLAPVDQKLKKESEVENSSKGDVDCNNVVCKVDEDWTSQMCQGSKLETHNCCSQLRESKPKSWVDYVMGCETNPESVWFLEKTARAESAFEALGTVIMEEDYTFDGALNASEKNDDAWMENVGESIQNLLTKLQTDGKFKEDMIKGVKADAKLNEQGVVNSSCMVSDIKGLNCSFSHQMEISNESNTEDGDASSSAWERTLDSSENGRSSSVWRGGSDISDIASAALDKENSSWKMGTMITDQVCMASDLSLLSSEKNTYNRFNQSTDWDSDDNLDPYVKLFAEGLSDAEDSVRQQPVQGWHGEPDGNPFRQRASAASNQKNVGERAVSSEGIRHSKKRGVCGICRAVRAFQGRFSAKKLCSFCI